MVEQTIEMVWHRPSDTFIRADECRIVDVPVEINNDDEKRQNWFISTTIKAWKIVKAS